MAISSPLDLSPLVWLNPTAGTYNGSNQLTALTNPGSVGGSFTINGTPAKGAAAGLWATTLRCDDITKYLDLTFGLSTGALTVVWWGKQLAAGSGAYGQLGMGWPGDGTAKVFYTDVGAGDLYAFGNACCDPASFPPAYYSAAGGLTDTGFHRMLWQLGTTNALYKDNVSQTLTTQSTGAIPVLASGLWNFCIADPSIFTDESAKSDIAGVLVFDKFLTSGERNDLDSWIQTGGVSDTLMGQIIMKGDHRAPLAKKHRKLLDDRQSRRWREADRSPYPDMLPLLGAGHPQPGTYAGA